MLSILKSMHKKACTSILCFARLYPALQPTLYWLGTKLHCALLLPIFFPSSLLKHWMSSLLLKHCSKGSSKPGLWTGLWTRDCDPIQQLRNKNLNAYRLILCQNSFVHLSIEYAYLRHFKNHSNAHMICL